MAPTSYERREVAGALRQMAEKHSAVEASRVAHTLGLEYEVHGAIVAFGSDAVQAIADLIDPTCTVAEECEHGWLTPSCPSCGYSLRLGDRYCGHCGARVVREGED